MTDQQPQSGGVIAIAWILTVLTFGYMLPWAIAATRGTSNQGPVAIVNVLTGWTLIGWIVALVMACQAHRIIYPAQTVVVAQQFVQTPAGWYPAPDGFGRQYWDGQTWTPHRSD